MSRMAQPAAGLLAGKLPANRLGNAQNARINGFAGIGAVVVRRAFGFTLRPFFLFHGGDTSDRHSCVGRPAPGSK